MLNPQYVEPEKPRVDPRLQPALFQKLKPRCTPAQQERMERCIRDLKAKGGSNPWAVCTASIGCRQPSSRRGSRMSAGLLDLLVQGATQAAGMTVGATLVSRLMGGGGLAVTSPEAVIRVIDDREEARKREEAEKKRAKTAGVYSPSTVEGDGASVDLGTLLAEIDSILSNPSKMGEVNPATLQVTRSGS